MAALGAIAIIVVGLAACGTGSSDEIVAHVAGVGSISKGTLNHWIPIEARLLYEEVPKKAAPSGVVPDPPAYTACVTYLKSTRRKIVETAPKPTAAQLKSKCAQKYQNVKMLALNTLIGWEWTIGTGAAAGMKVSDAEVKQRLEAVKKNDLLDVSFKKYLKYSGQTLSDMLFRSKVQLFEVKLRQREITMAKLLSKHPTVRQREKAFAKLTEGLPTTKQWVARTSCRTGYVTSSCKQYRGSLSPGIPN